MDFVDLIGWVATLLIIFSFLQKKMLRLRLLSLVGALFWMVWGFISSSWSVVFLNVVISIIQVYWIFKIRLKNKKSYEEF